MIIFPQDVNVYHDPPAQGEYTEEHFNTFHFTFQGKDDGAKAHVHHKRSALNKTEGGRRKKKSEAQAAKMSTLNILEAS